MGGWDAETEASQLLSKLVQNEQDVTRWTRVAAGVSAFAQGTAMLAVSEETRDISGGFILKDGRIEVNCTFDALVRAEREQTAGEVAKLLFPEA